MASSRAAPQSSRAIGIYTCAVHRNPAQPHEHEGVSGTINGTENLHVHWRWPRELKPIERFLSTTTRQG